MEKIFLLKGLDCPHCAAEIGQEVGLLTGVQSANVNLMKQSLTVIMDEADPEIGKRIEAIVHRHEPEVEVSELEAKRSVSHTHEDEKPMLPRLILGAVLYAAGLVLGKLLHLPLPVELAFLIAAYIILGGDVVLKAVRNITRGRVFDENFLMSLSTIGAFVIGEYPEAVAVMLFYQVGEWFQSMAVRRSRKSIAALMDIRPDFATVERNGKPQVVPAETVQVGELIIVKPGERIALDGVVAHGSSTLDTMALTGESVPRTVKEGETALSGCINLSSVLTIRVTKPFGESTAAKIIDLVENASARKAPAENFITAFARWYTPCVAILAVLLAVLPPLLFDGQWAEWIHRGFVFLVISCPCALVISIPLTFFGGIGAASRHGVLVKGGNYLDALNKVDTVVFDKTCTLTKGVFQVTHVEAAPGFTPEQVMEHAALAESLSNHPIARSILTAYGKEVDRTGITEHKEIAGHGVCVETAGQRIAAGNTKLMDAEGVPYQVCEHIGTKVYVAVNGCYAGCIVISDMLKPDSAVAIAALRKRGVRRCVMLTGDNEHIASAVARDLKLDAYHAQLLPHQKVEVLEQLDKAKRPGSALAFLGDGINDAPVLARADIGIAMGGLGSDAAIEAADVVLMTDEPSKLVEAMDVARATRRIVTQNIVIALGIKLVFLVLGAFGIAGMWEAVFGDVGVAMIAVLNAMRILKK